MSHKFRFQDAAMNRITAFNNRTAEESVRSPEKEKKEEKKRLDHTLTEGKPLVVTRTDVGRVRKSNQDAVIDAWPVLGVADGMGGHQGGEIASASTRELLLDYLKDKEPDAALLRAAVSAVNHKLFLKQQDEENLRGMGTTLTVLWIGPQDILCAHVGDSRCYRLRDGELTQLTSDHSMVAEMVREGLITQEQAAVHPMRNIITRAVATEDTVDADMLTFQRKKGDLYLVCSDGLYGMMPDETIRELMNTLPVREAADALLREALDRGGKDNVSIALLLDTEGAHE